MRKQAGDDFTASERGEGERLNELLRCGGHDDLYLMSALREGAHQLSRFVRRDSAADPEYDAHVRRKLFRFR